MPAELQTGAGNTSRDSLLPTFTSPLFRDLTALEARPFDMLVVGGGIVGACVARDAALRGLSVALVERADFASGTSSNSLKLVHGGLRYLQRLELRVMRESVRERSAWLRVAPHLVHPVPVVVPLYGKGVERLPVMRAALLLNDLLSVDRNRGLPAERSLPPGRALSSAECRDLVPDLSPSGLVGGVMFHDAQMYSSERLVLEVLEGAAAAGAVIANYVECHSTTANDGGLEITCVDREAGSPLRIRSKMVVNATGASASEATDRMFDGTVPPPRYSVAMNVMIAARGYPAAFAISGPGAGSARGANKRLFVVPWRGRTMVGTAHYPLLTSEGPALEPERYLARFLEEINQAWPGESIGEDEVLKVHLGLLPVASGAGLDSVTLLRRGQVIENSRRILTLASVKFTTARALAERAVDRVVARLGQPALRCSTLSTPLPGAPLDSFARLADEARRSRPDLQDDVLDHLVRSYGRRYGLVAPPPGAPVVRVVEGSPVIVDQFDFGCQHEMALRPDDLVNRRTELGATATGMQQAMQVADAIIMLRRRDQSLQSVGRDPPRDP